MKSRATPTFLEVAALRVPRGIFGLACLSLSAGLMLYWFTFVAAIPDAVKTRNPTVIPLLNGVVGGACCALTGLALVNVLPSRRRAGEKEHGIVLVRRPSGGAYLRWSRRGGEVLRRNVSGNDKRRGRSRLNVKALAFLAALPVASLILSSGGFIPAFMAVSSTSMAPALNVGDLVFLCGRSGGDIRVGDVIAFDVPHPYRGTTPSPVIHRVVERIVMDGKLYYRTKGDNNPRVDPWTVPAENVIGTVTFKIPYLGYLVLFVKSVYGLVASAALILAWTLRPYLKKILEAY